MGDDAAKNLRAARKAAGHATAAGAADAVGMNRHYLARLELGRCRPRWSTMTRLIGGLNLGLEWFFPPDRIVEAAERIRNESAKGHERP